MKTLLLLRNPLGVLLMVGLAGLVVLAAEYETIITTNRLTDPFLVTVRGRNYNIAKSVLWISHRVTVREIHGNLVRVQALEEVKVPVPRRRGDPARRGNFIGGSTSPRYTSYEEPGREFVLTNYPIEGLVIGDTIRVVVMKVGTVKWPRTGEQPELWDAGELWVRELVLTNRVIRRKEPAKK